MDDDQPLGGKWNYDAQNRHSFKQDDLSNIPDPLLFANDVQDILHGIEKYDIATIGISAEQLLWPIKPPTSAATVKLFLPILAGQFWYLPRCHDGKRAIFVEFVSFPAFVRPKHKDDRANGSHSGGFGLLGKTPA